MSDETSESELEGGTPKDKTLPSLVPPCSKKFSIWKWWGIHDSKFVSIGTILAAIATSLMAFFTYCSIEEARKMREETKKLVDLSIQDFRIRAYPSFLIEKPIVDWHEKQFIEEITVYNKGDITAHNVTMLFVRVFARPQNHLLFTHDLSPYYKEQEYKTTINYETKLFKEGSVTVTSKRSFDKDNTNDKLAYLILYFRFKIPFDDQFRYEAFGFILKEKFDKGNAAKQNYFWQQVDEQTKDTLIKRHLSILKDDESEQIHSFLKDYPDLKSKE